MHLSLLANVEQIFLHSLRCSSGLRLELYESIYSILLSLGQYILVAWGNLSIGLKGLSAILKKLVAFLFMYATQQTFGFIN